MVVNDPGRQASSGARVLGGRYRLLARRGTGYDAAVFDAVDDTTDQRVTVKVVHPDLCADPDIRVRLASALDQALTVRHAHLASVLDWGSEQWNERDIVYVVVEHLGGGSLREIIDRGRRLSPSQGLQLGLEVCRGLAALHEVQHAHGDVRPSTVVFGTDGRARLVDIGIGEVLAQVNWADPTRVTNERAGYAAPERGQDSEIGPKGDVYSLCVTLLEATSGQVPLVGESTVATLQGRVGKLMPVSADLGPLASVLERAGRPDPADRWTAVEFGRALAQASASLPRPAPIPLVSGGLFDNPPDAATQAVPVVAAATGAVVALGVGDPYDPTFPTPRPAADQPLTVVEQTDTPAPTTVSPAMAPPSPATAVLPAVDAPADEAPQRVSWLRKLRLGRLLLVAVLGFAVGAALGFLLTPIASHEVPDLVGVERGEALNTISEFGWQVTITREASDTVPIDVVIRTEPVAGETVREGEAFDMVVSNGPAPRELPDLDGLTVEEATAQLASLGLVLLQGEPEFSETVPVGVILRWSVPVAPTLGAGDTVVIGTGVEVITSKGPAPRVVPDLTGLDPAAAEAVLAQNGLTGNQVAEQQFSDTVAAGLVMSQDPAPGTAASRGGTVTYVISKGPDVVPLPPLVGRSLGDATAALVSSGFQVGQATGNILGTVSEIQVDGVSVVDGAAVRRGATVNLVLI
jgi:serine/threonine-protein kinase